MKSNAQLARAATSLAVGVAGLFIIRLIIQNLPMFQDAGWVVKGKLTILATALMVIDAILISVLAGFAVQVKAYVQRRFAEVPGLAIMSASLVVLLCAVLAYTDFKPITRTWPAFKDVYLWSFFVFVLALLVQLIVLLYQNKDRIAALILRQPMPVDSEDRGSRGKAEAAFAGR